MKQANVMPKQQVSSDVDAVALSASDLRKLKNCEKSYQLSKLGLQMNGWQAQDWIFRMLELIKESAIVGESAEKMRLLVEERASEVQESWYSCKTEADAERAKVVQILHRFIDYLSKYTVCAINQAYTIHVNSLKYRGVSMNGCKCMDISWMKTVRKMRS